ncbi:MAG: branched-chain amino acid ABC transporter permease [Actinomycetota bacterium]|nr:branched-chain amino acid ABC transporter permease [Actinomycetota bacterium]
MTEFLQSLSRGLGTGSLYALLAVGFVIIYKSTLVISFAQPALMVAGAVAVTYLAVDFGLNFFVAVPIAVIATAALGLVVERVALRPMVGKPVFVIAIITLGVDIFIRVIVNRFIGLNVRQVGDPWGLNVIDVGGVVIQQRYLAMVVTTAAVVAALFAFFKYSRIGLAMRATAFDQETALAQGISVGTVFALSWAIAGGLAALAGTFLGTSAGIDQQTWLVALKALPAIILGGLDSIGGAVVGGLAVGVLESLVGTYQGQYAPWLGQNFAVVSPYVLMLLVLLVRPYGLFGTPEVERV